MDISFSKYLFLEYLVETSLYKTNREKIRNEHKMRIRHFLEVTEENVRERVLLLFELPFENRLHPSHIVSCEIVDSWCGLPSCKDILVTFDSVEVRDMVLYALEKEVVEIQNLLGQYVQFDDELGKERLRVWKQAVNDFPNNYVFTADGAICIQLGYEVFTIHTLKEYRKFVRRRLSSLETIKEELEKTE